MDKESFTASDLSAAKSLASTYIVILDDATKIIRHAIFISQQYATTSTNNIATIFCQHSILKIMLVYLAVHDLIDIFFISGAVIRMDMFHPGICNSLHIFVR